MKKFILLLLAASAALGYFAIRNRRAQNPPDESDDIFAQDLQQ